jgi:hypothetical protein
VSQELVLTTFAYSVLQNENDTNLKIVKIFVPAVERAYSNAFIDRKGYHQRNSTSKLRARVNFMCVATVALIRLVTGILEEMFLGAAGLKIDKMWTVKYLGIPLGGPPPVWIYRVGYGVFTLIVCT